MDKVEKMEKELRELAEKIYESSERRIQPSYPWLLVRVVPKEQKVGGIVLSENSGSREQNKPLWEGIILATWKPFTDRFKSLKHEGVEYHKFMQSEFELGDRVIFPHHSGLPVNFLDDRHYRLVREITNDPIGGAMCKLHYDGDRKYKDALNELFADAHSITMSGK